MRLRIERIQWANIESGQQSVPAERMVEICGILQWTPEQLLAWTPAQSPVHLLEESDDNAVIAEAA